MPANHDDVFDDYGEFSRGLSALVGLEELHLQGFHELSLWPADMAAALEPLSRLRALVRHDHAFRELRSQQQRSCQVHIDQICVGINSNPLQGFLIY